MRVIAALLLLAAVLTGCGSETSQTSGPPASDSATPSQATTEPSEPAESEPTVKPASGPELTAKGFSCSVPKGWADTSGDAPEGILLSAADLRDADDNPAMLTVSRVDRAPTSIDDATRISAEEPMTIAGHEAVHVHGVTADAGAHYRIDQYVVPTADAAWVIRISTNQYLTADYRGRAVDSILASCRISS